MLLLQELKALLDESSMWHQPLHRGGSKIKTPNRAVINSFVGSIVGNATAEACKHSNHCSSHIKHAFDFWKEHTIPDVIVQHNDEYADNLEKEVRLCLTNIGFPVKD